MMSCRLGIARRAGLAVAILLVPAPSLEARTWRVMRDGSADFTTIQPAVDAASPGDTISIGPGRYDEMTLFTPLPGKQGWPKLTCIGVGVDSLVFLGDSADSVLVGPETPNYTIDGPEGIVNMVGATNLVVENLTLENVYEGAYLFGYVAFRDAVCRSCRHGIVHWAEASLHVEDCRFVGTFDGIAALDGTDVKIRFCTFEGNTFGVDMINTTGVEVRNSTFVGNNVGIQFEQGSTGTIEQNVIQDSGVCGLIVTLGSHASVTDNVITDGRWGIYIDPACTISGSGNRVGPCSSSTLFFWGATSVFQGNHVLNGGGYSVYCEGFGAPPVRTIDLTNNYWGTTSADSIAAWIRDGNDDPALHVNVDFEPFSPVPVPERKETMGGVKALFRGRR